MKYSVNIEVIYKELPFAERFAAAKRDGFDYVEIWDWESKNLNELKALCARHGLAISCMGGDGPISLCDPAHGEEYLAYLRRSLKVAQEVGCKLLAVHSTFRASRHSVTPAASASGAIADRERYIAMVFSASLYCGNRSAAYCFGSGSSSLEWTANSLQPTSCATFKERRR